MSDSNNSSNEQPMSKEEFLSNLAENSISSDFNTFSADESAPSLENIKESDIFDPNGLDEIDRIKAENAAQKEEETADEAIPDKDTEEENKQEDPEEDNNTDKEEVEGTSDKEEVVGLDAEKVYQIPVDGKMVEITGAELQARASAEIAIEKRFAEVDKRNKELYAKQEAEDKLLLDRKERILSGDIFGALADMFKLPVYTLKDSLLTSLEPEVLRRAQMSPEQQEAQRVLDERKFYKDSYESKLREEEELQKKSAQAAAENAINLEVSQAKETHNITDEQWDAARKHLDETLDSSYKQIPIDMIIDLANKNAKDSVNKAPEVDFTAMADSAIREYKDHINPEFKEKLLDFIKVTPDLTQEQINEIVKSSVQKGLKEKLLGSSEVESSPQLTKEQKLKKLQEEALAQTMPNKPDGEKNWF